MFYEHGLVLGYVRRRSCHLCSRFCHLCRRSASFWSFLSSFSVVFAVVFVIFNVVRRHVCCLFVVFAVARRHRCCLFCHCSSSSSSASLLSVLRVLPTASIEWGPHISGPQFTHWSAVAVRKISVCKLHVRRSASPHFTGARRLVPGREFKSPQVTGMI